MAGKKKGKKKQSKKKQTTNALVFGTAGAHRLLGFHNSSTNPFIAGTLPAALPHRS
jgi:hypothetical protein